MPILPKFGDIDNGKDNLKVILSMENLNYLLYFSRLFAQIIIIPDFHIVPLFYCPSFLTIHTIDSR